VSAVRVARADLDAVLAHAREGAPLEVCGALVGRREEDDIVVERVLRTGNAHATPRVNYLIPPEELLAIVLRAEDEWGSEVVGFYHSHPAGPPHLSKTDHAWASWSGAVYLLQWLAPKVGVGAWTWNEQEKEFAPLAIEVR
jgi:desampylase